MDISTNKITKISIKLKQPKKIPLKLKATFTMKLPHGQSSVTIYPIIPHNIQLSDEIYQILWNLHPNKLGTGIVYGQNITFKRWDQAYGLDYKYSGKIHKALPIENHFLKTLLAWVREHSKLPYEGLLINWYENGQHYIGEHSDDEKSLISCAPIYSFSFGQDRDFVIKSKDKTYRKTINMNNNSLIIMSGEMQKYYKHSVPVRALSTCPKSRINITFRLFKKTT